MINKVKSIIFLATIKLKVYVILDIGANKNLQYETLVPKEDQQTLL